MRASSILSRSPISSVIAFLQRFEPLLVRKPKRHSINLPNTDDRSSALHHIGGPAVSGVSEPRRRHSKREEIRGPVLQRRGSTKCYQFLNLCQPPRLLDRRRVRREVADIEHCP